MKRTFAIFAATTALTLGACGSPSEDEAAATSAQAAPSSTVTEQVSAEETTETPAETSGNSAADESDASGEIQAPEGTTPPDAGTPPPENGGSGQEPENPESPENPQQPGQPVEDFQAAMTEQMRTNGNIGDTFMIDGQATELCIHGDGYGINVVTAGENTTCEFAKNVFNAATDGTNPTADNVREGLPKTVNAQSEATGDSYDMNCSVDNRNLVTCTGGDNAAVYMY